MDAVRRIIAGFCNDGITLAYSGNMLMSIGATSPPAISRFDASPDADTPSYRVPPPCVIRFTMSAESVPYFTSTLHPVSCSNGFTHESSV